MSEKKVYTLIAGLPPLPVSGITDSMLVIIEGPLGTYKGTVAELKTYLGAGGSEPVIGTHAELLALMQGNSLTPGQTYIMEDFTTIYDQPDFNADGTPKAVVQTKTGANEVLVLTAMGTNSFKPQVGSLNYPKDLLEYDITWIATEKMGAPAKGRITSRVDDKNNRTDYDHRTVLFKRYAPGPGVYSADADFMDYKDTGGDAREYLTFHATLINSNYIGDYAVFHADFSEPFLLPNNVFIGDWAYFNYTKDYFINNTLRNCGSNLFGSFTVGNKAQQDFNGNKIGDSMGACTFIGSFNENIVGDAFETNTFASTANGNTFGPGFQNNTCNGLLQSNDFGKDCSTNVIWEFGYNKVWAGFQNNTFTSGVQVNFNTFGAQCNGNTFSGLVSNEIGSGFSDNTFIASTTATANKFGPDCTGCTFGSLRRLKTCWGLSSIDFTSATLVNGNIDKEIVSTAGAGQKLIYYSGTAITFANITD